MGVFASVEAYWYWLGVAANNPKRETLRHTYGFRAKELGRELGAPDWQDGEDFRAAICATIESKIRANPDLRSALASSTLPLEHYDVVFGQATLFRGMGGDVRPCGGFRDP